MKTWAAEKDENPLLWGAEEATSRRLRWRVLQWKTFPLARRLNSHYQKNRCTVYDCRAYGDDLRDTPIGRTCFSCWLEWPSCQECGVAPREPSYDGLATFQGRHLCAECLCPPISEGYIRWSLEWWTSFGSGFSMLLSDVPCLNYKAVHVTVSV